MKDERNGGLGVLSFRELLATYIFAPFVRLPRDTFLTLTFEHRL